MGNWAAHGDAAVSEVAQENSPGTRPDDNVATLATIAIQGRAAVEYQHCNQVRTGLWPISCDQGCSFWGAALPVLPRQSVIPRSHPPISPGIRTTVAPSSPSMLVLTRRAFFSSLQPSRQWEDSGRPHSVLSAGKTAFCRLAPQHERCSGSTSGSGSGCGCTW
jgi:hypothetical protein